MIENVIDILSRKRRLKRRGAKSTLTERQIVYYNGAVIKSEKVRIAYDHFKRTGEKLKYEKIEVDINRIKHLLI